MTAAPPSPPTPDRVAEIAARLKAATPGPWYAEGDHVVVDTREQVCCGRGYEECCGNPDIVGDYGLIAHTDPANAAFISATPADVAWLLTALAAKDAEVDRLTAEAAAVRAAALEEAAQVAEADAAEAALDKTGSKLSHEVWLTAVRLANAIRALGAGGQP